MGCVEKMFQCMVVKGMVGWGGVERMVSIFSIFLGFHILVT